MNNNHSYKEENHETEREGQAHLNTKSHASDVHENASYKKKSFADKRFKKAGIAMVAVIIFSVFMSITFHPASIDVSKDAELALEQQFSSTLSIGTRLMEKDDQLDGQDVTIKHSNIEDKTNIHVWDYAAEDGDYVQIIVDGEPLGDPFMIKHKPMVFEVPSTGEIEVIGVRDGDGGGGITYAIHYDLNGTTYFNSTSVGDKNTYTLIKE